MASMLHGAVSRLERICEDRADLLEALERLRYPEETLSASVPLRRDDGRLDMIKAWRCRYNALRGPTKGGIRFHHGVTMDEVMTLAFWMTLKTAVAGLPYGGAKGGAAIDANMLSARELELMSRGYMRMFADFVGPDRDIPAPDLATSGKPIAWMADEYFHIVRRCEPAVITGKPVSFFGSVGRDGATGRGAALCLDSVAELLDFDIDGAAVAVQGFGTAGARVAQELTARGARIVAVSDSSGAVQRDSGLDLGALEQHKAREGRVSGFAGGDELERDAAPTLGCDLLVPAALGGVITADNAGDIRVKAILEVANGPVLPEADETLADAGIVVIPDILANGGGVTVSYFEWVQNRTGDYWSAEEVDRRLKERMARATRQVVEAGFDRLRLRDAANQVALTHIRQTVNDLGTRDLYSGQR